MSVYVKLLSGKMLNMSQVRSFELIFAKIYVDMYGGNQYIDNERSAVMWGGLIEYEINNNVPYHDKFELCKFTTYEKAENFYKLLQHALNSNDNHVFNVIDYCGYKELLDVEKPKHTGVYEIDRKNAEDWEVVCKARFAKYVKDNNLAY